MKSRLFCGASVLAAMCALGASPALAQDDQGATVSEVVVTGSFIAGTPEDAALPVDVIGADELQKQGSPTPVELMKGLTVSNGVIGDTNQFDGRAQGAEGAATVNLRGLGASRTLVLFNGRRLVNAPIGQGAPDINLLPGAAVGRLEVLKDGAAAIYGSDAIGGVVNFITRKNLDGLEISADYRGIKGGNGDYGGSIAWGHTADWGNVLLTAGWQHRSELNVRDRDFATGPYQDNPESGWSSGGNPSTFLPLGPAPAPAPPGFFAPVAGLQRDSGCAALGGFPGFAAATTPACFWNYTPYDNLVEKEDRWQIYGEVNYDITDDVQAHLEGFYSETDTPEWKTSPSYLALQVPTNVTNPTANTPGLNAGYFVPATNPGYIAYRAANPTQLPASAVGAYFPGSLFRPLGLAGNPLWDDKSSRGSRKYEAYRLSGSLTGKFENGLGFDLAATYMEDNLVRIGYDTVVSRLQLALRGL
ncbi:MAG TPA: TonB-dependent receptor plug domain-containing protein, partial [Phenylobacterium sp.]|nr:TonB-dependent receptor plug domain-containing protein [Phenylobacterium sp.]